MNIDLQTSFWKVFWKLNWSHFVLSKSWQPKYSKKIVDWGKMLVKSNMLPGQEENLPEPVLSPPTPLTNVLCCWWKPACWLQSEAESRTMTVSWQAKAHCTRPSQDLFHCTSSMGRNTVWVSHAWGTIVTDVEHNGPVHYYIGYCTFILEC